METRKLVIAFKEELSLTDQGLADLKEKKQGLILDVKTDSGFKEARKERTERNKIIKSIDEMAIGGKNAVDEARQQLKDEVNSVYHSIVSQFEAEEIVRKKKAAEAKDKEDKRIAGIRERIENIRSYARTAKGQSIEDISACIESIDLIDPSENFEEFTQEALQAIKEVLAELSIELNLAQQNKKLADDREKLRKQQEEQDKLVKLANLKAQAQERLNKLSMIPSDMFGKEYKAIQTKIKALQAFEVLDEEFLDLKEQAVERVTQVIMQLETMAKLAGQQEAEQARIAAELLENEVAEQEFIAQAEVLPEEHQVSTIEKAVIANTVIEHVAKKEVANQYLSPVEVEALIQFLNVMKTATKPDFFHTLQEHMEAYIKVNRA